MPLAFRAAFVLITMLGTVISGGIATALERLEFRMPAGNDVLSRAVRGASLVQSLTASGESEPQDLLAAARADYGRILAALYATGHYSAVIRISVDGREAASIPPLEVPRAISSIVITVDPGPLFRLNLARVQPLASGTELPEEFRRGQPAQSGLIGEAVDRAILGWRELGYTKARVADQAVIADHATQQLDVDVRLVPGPKLRFGQLEVQGEVRMREQRIKKIAGLPEGKTFSETALRLAETRLRRTGIFSSVTLEEDEAITAPDLLGVTATVVEQKPRRYSFGVEVASLDGVSLEGSWLHRNLLGGGERLKVEGSASNIGAEAGAIDYNLGVTLDRPATLTPDTTAGLSFDFSHFDDNNITFDSVEFGLNFSHWFSDQLTATAGLTYSYLDGTDPGGDILFQNLALPISVNWDRRDTLRDSTGGFYLDATAMPFLGFGTTDSGIRGTLDARTYRGLGSADRVVLAFRAQAGVVLGSDLLQTPPDLLFYSGGGGTVRGQPYQSLGIPVVKGLSPPFLVGGRYFLAGSAEVRVRVTPKIGVVAFVDVGSVGVDGFLDGAVDPHAGAGLGLRYNTGFGPIRVDIAAPISGNTGDGVQLYVGLGQAF